MNNLTTRKIVLGLLITLVLAFSVQGIADALTTPTISSNPAELSTLNTGSTITVTISSGSFNRHEGLEFLTFTVNNSATFPDPDNPTTFVSTERWTEVDSALDDTSNGAFDRAIPSLTVTVPNVGLVTATVTWMQSDGNTGNLTRAFYVVNPTNAAAEGIMFDTSADMGNNGFEFKSGGDHTIGLYRK